MQTLSESHGEQDDGGWLFPQQIQMSNSAAAEELRMPISS